MAADLPIYVDGSCLNPTMLHISRAGSSAVQTDNQGQFVRAVRAMLPRQYPQLSGHAEHAGLQLAIQWSEHPRTAPIIVDYSGLMRGFLRPDQVLQGTSIFATYWRKIASYLLVNAWIEMRKTKAHRREDAAINVQDALDIHGNKAADHHAKEAAKLHAVHADDAAEHEAALHMYKSLVIGAGKILALWPPAKEIWPDIAKPPPQRAARPFVQDHDPVWNGSVFRCRSCLKVVSARTRSSCKPVPDKIRDMAAAARGHHHKIAYCTILGSKLPVIFCRECGGFTSGRGSPKLSANCTRKVSSELRKLQKNELPGSG